MGDLIEEYGEIVVLVILGIGICAAFINKINLKELMANMHGLL